MAHLALYRKYRSQTFGDLVGQEHVVRTLQNAISQGRLAHAFLFTGPRGTGKTSTARLLAKALNCDRGMNVEPCNECGSCRAITEGSHMDVLEMDAASESKVEQVRELIVSAADYQPTSGRCRVFVIDEVHDLSSKAFDALLKTIEEPPAHVYFILATTELNKVPPTIRSRCQRFEFHRGTVGELERRLNHVATLEGCDIEPAAISAIARMADGGFRDALTLLEQAILTSEGRITAERVFAQLGLISDESADTMIRAIRDRDGAQVVLALEASYRRGHDPRMIVEALLMRLAELTRAYYQIDSDRDASVNAALRSAAVELGPEALLRIRNGISATHSRIREMSLPRIWLESELLRLALQDQPRPTIAPELRHETPAPSIPVPTPAASAQNPDDPLVEVWRQVVEKLSAMSPTAKANLRHTRYAGVEDGTAQIQVTSNLCASWLEKNAKIKPAIEEHWHKLVPNGTPLAFVGVASTAPDPKNIETKAVELPSQGEELRKMVVEVFEGHIDKGSQL